MRSFLALLFWSALGPAALVLGACGSEKTGPACVEATEGQVAPRTLTEGDPYCHSDAECRTTCKCRNGASDAREWKCERLACDGASLACWKFCFDRDSMVESIKGSDVTQETSPTTPATSAGDPCSSSAH
jgi:hypothetical protein